MNLLTGATELIEHDDHLEIKLADWYINVGEKFIADTVIRQEHCNDLQEYYHFLKNIKDD